MATCLYGARVLTPNETLEPAALVVGEDGRIAYVGSLERAPRSDGVHLDLRGLIAVPGFIDIHQQGGNGVTFAVNPDDLDTVPQLLQDYAAWVPCRGVTGFLCSIGAGSVPELCNLVAAFVDAMESGVAGAEPLGLHLEGPYLSEEKRGAINPAWVRPPSTQEVELLLQAGRGWIRQTTMSPELPGVMELAGRFRAAGVVAAIGHSDADYETARAALQGNFTHITHAFNAQRAFTHRQPGLVGATLASEHASVEVIADGVHVHPAALRILVRCIGVDRTVLITDSIAAAGAGDGEYWIGDQLRIVKDGVSRLSNGHLAGSVATLDLCVRNMHHLVGLPLHEAVKMATLNPARAMGFADRLGTLAVGKDASLTVIDEQVNIYLTMVKGRVVYSNL